MRPRHILVPVDMSAVSARALRYASAWALAAGARISVVLVEEYELPAYLSSAVEERVVTMLDSERRYVKERLKAFALPLVDAAARPNFYVYRGLPAVFILKAVKSLGADAVVMGTHGRSGFKRFLLGSVTEAVVRVSPVPVLTVRAIEAEAGVDARAPWRPERVLAPVDARLGPDAVFRAACATARDFGAGVTALECVDADTFALIDDEVGRLEEWQRFFDRLPRDLRRPPPDLVLRGGDAAALIVREAAALRSGLIVIGAGRRRFASGWLMGTTAIRVLRYAECPVLVVPEAPRRTGRGRLAAAGAGGVS